MKRVLLSLVVVAGLAFSTTSCSKAKDSAKKAGDAVENAAEKTTEVAKDAANTVKDGAEKAVDAVKNAAGNDEQIAKGKELFTSKTCVACHGISNKVLGPSVKDIVKTYADKGANMVKFLKGNSEAIVDTDPAQVAIMKANIDGFLKELKAEELQAITAYMRSVAK